MKKAIMLLTAVGAATLLSACSAEHGTTMCTTAPQADWQNQEAFQAQLVAQGYKINEFKVTDGNCYEIYGFNKDENKVEIYFNPVDGSIVKEESH
ncbi:MAG: PepSY domain-containing protein [Alteromonas sp.]|uniref:PepSY domain-containing protein n=1 Tax=unclassified Alteromonas TaxID=2614992 RepID=UPI000509B5F5|nr:MULTISPECIES: PepSY domain-containing protein [unclassified Alteromonas]